MDTYEEGYNLAKRDVVRFGFLHATDKAKVLDGPVGLGYNDALNTQMTAYR